MGKKVFCIGLNKTGTTSLHEAFKILGLKSVHFRDDKGNNIKTIIHNNFLNGNHIIKGLEKYDAFSDWGIDQDNLKVAKEFDKQCPNSKFILNTRDMDAWLNSRETHVKINQEKKRKNPKANITWLTVDREAWAKEFKNHYEEAERHFEGREDQLLIFDVTKGDGWEKLCPFLGLPIPAVPFPKRNVAAENKDFFKRVINKIKKYLPITTTGFSLRPQH